MTRIFILFFLLPSNIFAGDQCDLSQSVGVQLPSGQILGIKDLVADFTLKVTQISCSKGANGDDCNGALDPNSQILDIVKTQLASKLKVDKSSLKYIKKPNMRQPASQSYSNDLYGKCI
ncbi:MAG: hypothetical protein KA715_14040 [Xanthomonadaceae bacterium]|nr:hypothetical protein [Xanthomonadaceae bacterium]